MRVIGHREKYQTARVIIVEMTAYEFDLFAGSNMAQYAQRFADEQRDIDITERFKRVMAIEKSVAEVVKAPELLRSLAEIIAVSIPPIAAMVDPPKDEPAE